MLSLSTQDSSRDISQIPGGFLVLTEFPGGAPVPGWGAPFPGWGNCRQSPWVILETVNKVQQYSTAQLI